MKSDRHYVVECRSGEPAAWEQSHFCRGEFSSILTAKRVINTRGANCQYRIVRVDRTAVETILPKKKLAKR